jgi:hypothetical protein
MKRQLRRARRIPSLLDAEDPELEASFEAACDKLAKRKQFTGGSLFRRRHEIYKLVVRLSAEQLSTRWIAKVCQVSPGTIAAIRAREAKLIAIERKRILQITIAAARACLVRLVQLAPDMSASDASLAFSVACDKWLLLSRESERTLTTNKENDVIHASFTDLINSLPTADTKEVGAAEGSPTKTVTNDTRAGPRRSAPGQRITGATNNLRLANCYHGATRVQVFGAWKREAARLAREYLRSGRAIHFTAFKIHLGGMLQRFRESL